MSDFNLGNFLNSVVNYAALSANKGRPNAPNPNVSTDAKFQLTNEAVTQGMNKMPSPETAVLKSFDTLTLHELKMNNLASLERGLYMKSLMNLPKDMEELLVFIQNKAGTADATKLLTKNINLEVLAELLQQGGKEAMNKLVMVMANASRQGLTDVSQIKDAIKFINNSVSVAGDMNPEKTLKSFMLLYLPWLPLQEGVDFDLEIEGSSGGGDESELSITIMISTRNYGNIKVTLILVKGNSMSIFINCSEDFPKEELLKRLNVETKNHAIQSEIIFDQKPVSKQESRLGLPAQQHETETPQAKISMSNLSEVNPFMLLMANAVIRHTIELDNLAG